MSNGIEIVAPQSPNTWSECLRTSIRSTCHCPTQLLTGRPPPLVSREYTSHPSHDQSLKHPLIHLSIEHTSYVQELQRGGWTFSVKSLQRLEAGTAISTWPKNCWSKRPLSAGNDAQSSTTPNVDHDGRKASSAATQADVVLAHNFLPREEWWRAPAQSTSMSTGTRSNTGTKAHRHKSIRD